MSSYGVRYCKNTYKNTQNTQYLFVFRLKLFIDITDIRSGPYINQLVHYNNIYDSWTNIIESYDS